MTIQQRLRTFAGGGASIVQLRASFLRILVAFTVAMSLFIGGLQVAADIQLGSFSNLEIGLVVVFLVIDTLLLLSLRLERPGLTTGVLIIALVLMTAASSLLAENIDEAVAVLALIAAATLGNRAAYVGVILLVMTLLGGEFILIFRESGSVITIDGVNQLVLTFAVLIVGLATRYFVNTTQRSLDNANRNASLIQASADVGQLAARLLDQNELLTQAAERILERFALSHVQILLMNEGRDAVLPAATAGASSITGAMPEQRAETLVGAPGAVGQVAYKGTPLVIQDTERTRYRDELLPTTRSALVLPILDAETVIGVVQVQSTRLAAFQSNDIQAYTIIAGLLATAIRNARLFEAQSRTAAENQRLFQEAGSRLREIQRLNQQLTRTGWEKYLGEQQSAKGLNLNQEQLVQDSHWTDNLARAAQQRRPISSTNGEKQIVAVPVILRGEVIGAIEVEGGASIEESDTVEMVQAVAQRLALSLENARLFEETQQSASREQRINEIVGRYQAVTSVDELLRYTLTELSQTLGADRSAIRLGKVSANGSDHHD